MSILRFCRLFLAASVLALLDCAAHEATAQQPRMMSVAATQPATSQPAGRGLSKYKINPAYEKAMEAFDKSATMKPTGGTVFIGSSSFTRWKSLETDMAEFHAINRGFGGSRTNDLLYYEHRILDPLKPSRIVYFCGSNDLASKWSPQTAFENFKQFVVAARQISPGVKIYYLAANAAPVRSQYKAQFDELNRDVAKWAPTTTDVFFIDARPGLFDENGKAIESLFAKDRLHLNEQGNKIWMENIRGGLKARE